MLECYPRIEAAVKELDAGLLGIDILNSGIDFDLHNFLGAVHIYAVKTGCLNLRKQGKPRFNPFPCELWTIRKAHNCQ